MRKILAVISTTLLIVVSGFSAGKQLNVPYYWQSNANWCWAASASMVAKYYNQTPSSGTQIKPWWAAALLNKSKIDGGDHNESITVLETLDCSRSYSESFLCTLSDTISKNYIINQIDEGNPILVKSFDATSSNGHDFVITGYCDDGPIINDPSGALFAASGLINIYTSWSDFFDTIDTTLYADGWFISAEGSFDDDTTDTVSFDLCPCPLFYLLADNLIMFSGVESFAEYDDRLYLDWDGNNNHLGYLYKSKQNKRRNDDGSDPAYGNYVIYQDVLEFFPFMTCYSSSSKTIYFDMSVVNAGITVWTDQSSDISIPAYSHKFNKKVASLPIKDIFHQLTTDKCKLTMVCRDASTDVEQDRLEIGFRVDLVPDVLTVQSEPSGAAITLSSSDQDGNQSGSAPFTRKYSQGTELTLTAASSADDLVFKEWQCDGSTYSSVRSITIELDASVTYKAVYQSPSYTLYSCAGANGAVEPSGLTSVTDGGNSTFTATADDGYEVNSWWLDGNESQVGGTSYTLIDIDADHSVYVSFKEQSSSTINVTSPASGLIYYQKSKMSIAWEYSSEIGKTVKLELYQSGSLVCVIEEEDFVNNALYTWSIPTDVDVGDDYQIKVTSIASSISGFSGSFSISEAPSSDDVIEIDSADDLQKMASQGYYKLVKDIDLDGVDFVPISAFKGTLDGNGYCIKDLEIDRPTEENVALFRYTTENAVIKNLTIDGGFIRGLHSVGAICGEFNGLMENCHSSAEIRGNSEENSHTIGGLVGENYKGTIQNCSCTCPDDIRGYGDAIGGIAGENSQYGTIQFCWSTAAYIHGNDDSGMTIDNVGGIAGENYGVIRECFSSNTQVDSDDYYAGGIAGRNEGQIVDCYSLSPTYGDYIGGLVGYNDGGTVSNSFAIGGVHDTKGGGLLGTSSGGSAIACLWDTGTTGKTQSEYSGSGSFTDCYGKSTSEMEQASTFTDLGWDFSNVWQIVEGVSYPTLRSTQDTCDTPTGVAATTDRSDGIQVSWNSVENAGCYMVFRADSEDGNPQAVSGWITETSFLDTSAVEQVSYYYWIIAALTSHGAGESDLSSVVTGIRLAGPLSAPANVSASDGQLNSIIITWDSVPNASYYKVYRSDSASSAKEPLTEWQEDCSFVDTPDADNTTYYYWVKAATDSGGTRESGYSESDTGYYTLPSATLTLNVNPAEGGTVSGEGEYTVGQEVSISATPKSGWQFTQWNDGNTDNPRLVTVSEKGETYIAGFSEIQISILFLTPTTHSVSTNAGTTIFSVVNTGTGTMKWTAAVTDGSTWAQITSGTSGTNAGTIMVEYDANPSGSDERTATICVTAEGTTESPINVTITQIANSSGNGNTTTTEVAVPYTWLDKYGPVSNGDYETAANADTDGDGYFAWQEYLAGTIPTNRNSVFTAFIVISNGAPFVSWTPDLKTDRIYTVEGKNSLTDSEWGSTNETTRFFRVKVELP